MEKQSKINYSIIIPHKNIPELLSRCLKSIPVRDDVQVIVVDDNSDLNKVDFENFPGLNNPNTEIYFTKEGKGAGYARNVGLAKAKGRWLVFADADDFFNDCFNEILDKYKEGFNVVYIDGTFQTNSVDSETLGSRKSRGNHYNDWIKKSITAGSVFEELRYKFYSPCGKFVSLDLVKEHNIKFEEVFSSNDVMFSTLSGHYADKILLDLNYLYCSTIRGGSLEYTITKEHIQPRLYAAIRQYHFLFSVNKAKYRMNIWVFIFQLRKLDKKGFKHNIQYCIKEMRLTHLIQDSVKILIMFLKSK
mgnify:CR=1 FL=1